ncbi:hypothetical protein [Desulfosporosinus fructosivorans]
MVRKTVPRVDKRDLTLEVAPLPVTVPESENTTVPVLKVETEIISEVIPEEAPEVSPDETSDVSSIEGDKVSPDVKTLEQRIAELEEQFVNLQTVLYELDNKKKKKKGKKRNKVKCKCKDKTVDISECKCKSKKLD